MIRPGLTRQLTVAMFGYTVLLSLLIALHGYFVNEHAEQLTWESLLTSELRHFTQRRIDDPTYRWMDTDVLKLYGRANDRPIPPAFAHLDPGVHDEVRTDEGEFVVLVSGERRDRTIMTLDIATMEQSEAQMTWLIALSSLAIIAVLTLIAHFALRRLVRPLAALARDIGALRPDRSGQRIGLAAGAPAEAATIAAALTGYLERLDQFVERESAFVTTASHELRTPIAVVAGAAEVALGNQHASEAVRASLQHILHTARDMERLTTLLLVLARDPKRLRTTTEPVDLAQLLPDIVQSHYSMAERKELTLQMGPLTSCVIHAPRQIAAAAIGNLVRNAIENSDRGTIALDITADGAVIVRDPGHGMSPAEIRTLYSQLARSGARGGNGIGISLIARLCEHLGWHLAFESQLDRGTIATLRFARPH